MLSVRWLRMVHPSSVARSSAVSTFPRTSIKTERVQEEHERGLFEMLAE